MAYIRPIYTFVFLLALVTCIDILFTEGRQLKPMKKQEHIPLEGDRQIRAKQVDNPSKSHENLLGHEDDLQALHTSRTTSVGQSAAEKKEILSPKTPNPSSGFGDPVAAYIDDFKPKAAGNSPGFHHSFAGHKEDIQPMAQIGQKEDIQPRALLADIPGLGHSTTGNTDDVRHTNPGHSPGVGHSIQN